MPVEFLTDDEAAAYGRYAAAPSQAELEKIFFLDDGDRALVAQRRGDHMKLRFALQLVTVRYAGLFLEDPLDVPAVVVEFVAGSPPPPAPGPVAGHTGPGLPKLRPGARWPAVRAELLGQMPIDGGAGNAEGFGDLGGAFAPGVPCLGSGERVGVHDGGPAPVRPNKT